MSLCYRMQYYPSQSYQNKCQKTETSTSEYAEKRFKENIYIYDTSKVLND